MKMIDAKKKEFLGDDEDNDLKHLGFLDDNDKIDFSNFKVGRNADSEILEDDQTQTIFGRLTNAFKNLTGNKTLTAADIDPVMLEFSESLTNKNVSIEIA